MTKCGGVWLDIACITGIAFVFLAENVTFCMVHIQGMHNAFVICF